jgi:hypothetical protein
VNTKILTDSNGKPIRCQNTCCSRLARHVHHVHYRSNGGSDNPDNLQYLCEECHIALHSSAGDFRRWGRMGGRVTAATQKSLPNLKQFQGAQGSQRLAAYLSREGKDAGLHYTAAYIEQSN